MSWETYNHGMLGFIAVTLLLLVLGLSCTKSPLQPEPDYPWPEPGCVIVDNDQVCY